MRNFPLKMRGHIRFANFKRDA